MRSRFTPRRLLVFALAAAVVLAALAAVLVLVVFAPAAHKAAAPSGSQNPGLDPKAASYLKPWHPGNPQAPRFGEAFQILDPAHPPVHAQQIYWLGTGHGRLWPYVRAMQGHGAEVMLATVIYGDKTSADYAHLEITSWDTAPLVAGDQSEGGKLASLWARKPKQHSGAYSWVDSSPSQSGKGWQAIVKVGPLTFVQVIRLDSFAPALPAIIAALQPYQAQR